MKWSEVCMKWEQAPETLPCSTRKRLYAERKGTKPAKIRKSSGLDSKLTFLPHHFPDLQMLLCLVKVKVKVDLFLSYSKTNKMHWFLIFIFVIKLYMFRTVPLSIIRSFSLYTQQRYMSYRFADSLLASWNLYDIYRCCVYSEKLLMMDRGTVWNMQSFIPKTNLKN